VIAIAGILSTPMGRMSIHHSAASKAKALAKDKAACLAALAVKAPRSMLTKCILMHTGAVTLRANKERVLYFQHQC